MGTGANIPSGGSPEKYRSIETTAVVWDYYVDQVNGSDSNDGLTPLTPFATLTKARTETVSSGTAKNIYVFEGLYVENLIMSFDIFYDTHQLVWYFEKGAKLRTTDTIMTDPVTHFFGAPILSILGYGEIEYIGTGVLCDTTDAFFSVINISIHKLDYRATGTGSTPFILGDQSDNDIVIYIRERPDTLAEGQAGWTSSSVLGATDYFFTSVNPQFSKFGDIIQLVNDGEGKFQTFGGRCYIEDGTGITQAQINFYTNGSQNAGNAEGIKCTATLYFNCGQQGGNIGNFPVRSLNPGSTSVIEIINQNDDFYVFNSEIQVVGGTLRIENSKWRGQGRYIWVENNDLEIINCDIRGNVDQMVSSSVAGSTLLIRDSFLKTTVGTPVWLYSGTRNEIVNTFVISESTSAQSIGSNQIGGFDCIMSNTVGNNGLSLVNDVASGYTFNALFDTLA